MSIINNLTFNNIRNTSNRTFGTYYRNNQKLHYIYLHYRLRKKRNRKAPRH